MTARRLAVDSIEWDADKVRALREHLGLTQRQLAEELGVRQQTISEWEKGVYTPRRSSCTLLTMFAMEAGFVVKREK